MGHGGAVNTIAIKDAGAVSTGWVATLVEGSGAVADATGVLLCVSTITDTTCILVSGGVGAVRNAVATGVGEGGVVSQGLPGVGAVLDTVRRGVDIDNALATVVVGVGAVPNTGTVLNAGRKAGNCSSNTITAFVDMVRRGDSSAIVEVGTSTVSNTGGIGRANENAVAAGVSKMGDGGAVNTIAIKDAGAISTGRVATFVEGGGAVANTTGVLLGVSTITDATVILMSGGVGAIWDTVTAGVSEGGVVGQGLPGVGAVPDTVRGRGDIDNALATVVVGVGAIVNTGTVLNAGSKAGDGSGDTVTALFHVMGRNNASAIVEVGTSTVSNAGSIGRATGNAVAAGVGEVGNGRTVNTIAIKDAGAVLTGRVATLIEGSGAIADATSILLCVSAITNLAVVLVGIGISSIRNAVVAVVDEGGVVGQGLPGVGAVLDTVRRGVGIDNALATVVVGVGAIVNTGTVLNTRIEAGDGSGDTVAALVHVMGWGDSSTVVEVGASTVLDALRGLGATAVKQNTVTAAIGEVDQGVAANTVTVSGAGTIVADRLIALVEGSGAKALTTLILLGVSTITDTTVILVSGGVGAVRNAVATGVGEGGVVSQGLPGVGAIPDTVRRGVDIDNALATVVVGVGAIVNTSTVLDTRSEASYSGSHTVATLVDVVRRNNASAVVEVGASTVSHTGSIGLANENAVAARVSEVGNGGAVNTIAIKDTRAVSTGRVATLVEGGGAVADATGILLGVGAVANTAVILMGGGVGAVSNAVATGVGEVGLVGLGAPGVGAVFDTVGRGVDIDNALATVVVGVVTSPNTSTILDTRSEASYSGSHTVAALVHVMGRNNTSAVVEVDACTVSHAGSIGLANENAVATGVGEVGNGGAVNAIAIKDTGAVLTGRVATLVEGGGAVADATSILLGVGAVANTAVILMGGGVGAVSNAVATGVGEVGLVGLGAPGVGAVFDTVGRGVGVGNALAAVVVSVSAVPDTSAVLNTGRQANDRGSHTVATLVDMVRRNNASAVVEVGTSTVSHAGSIGLANENAVAAGVGEVGNGGAVNTIAIKDAGAVLTGRVATLVEGGGAVADATSILLGVGAVANTAVILMGSGVGAVNNAVATGILEVGLVGLGAPSIGAVLDAVGRGINGEDTLVTAVNIERGELVVRASKTLGRLGAGAEEGGEPVGLSPGLGVRAGAAIEMVVGAEVQGAVGEVLEAPKVGVLGANGSGGFVGQISARQDRGVGQEVAGDAGGTEGLKDEAGVGRVRGGVGGEAEVVGVVAVMDAVGGERATSGADAAEVIGMTTTVAGTVPLGGEAAATGRVRGGVAVPDTIAAADVDRGLTEATGAEVVVARVAGRDINEDLLEEVADQVGGVG